ncbi:hypothetical protein NQ317_000988 [Molorchus minor]|uniref:Exonuclease domain-containing protein n=1 Tax=Molorchus minor TaxID=1323400 RepID=A0ABQ9JQ23_9CUCU|nr:hypothetical protein NQ317_000988 [Molorchus minor]
MKQFKFSFEISSKSEKKCTFVTWSDWDLGTCLKYECNRKGIKLPDMFTQWIDIRVLYKEHYFRKPKGLKGALLELGLEFEGNEHCGLHDARNTARLIGKMIKDGVLLKITTKF